METIIKAPEGRKSVATPAIKAHTDETAFIDHPVVDNLVTVVLELGAQLWTERKRLRTLEAVLVKGGLAADAVEAFTFSPEEEEAIREERDYFIETTFGALRRPINSKAQVELTEAWEKRDDF